MMIKRKEGPRSRRVYAALLATAFMLTAIVLPAMDVSGSQRIGTDGLDADPDVGIHNSYAWCSAVFPQDDGNYLWVGSNRDAGAAIIVTAGTGGYVDPMIYDVMGIPKMDSDRAGKIYRYNLDDPDAGWEFVYQNPAFTGYRKMIVFKDDLYVFVGTVNRLATPNFQYTAIYRFTPDFKPGDSPEVVMWERLPAYAVNSTREWYRSAFVFDDKLYVGTFDNKIYRTDGEWPEGTPRPVLTPSNGAAPGTIGSIGWEFVLDMATELNYVPGNLIWDIIGFNGSLYAFVGSAPGGFKVYKMTPDGNDWIIKQIVGNDDPEAPYPSGMGIAKHVTASPFLSTQFGDYVYVTTFISGPLFMAACAAGQVEAAFNQIYCPANIYRFDVNDNWEMVVGDANTATDAAGNYIRHAGNMRAGFYPGTDEYNPSANQYIWNMTEYNGRLYATTWDVGCFREIVPFMLASIFLQAYDIDNIGVTTPLLLSVFDDLSALTDALANGGYEGVSDGMNSIIRKYSARLAENPSGGSEEVLRAMLEEMTAEIFITLLQADDNVAVPAAAFLASLNSFLGAVDLSSPQAQDAFKKTMDAYNACAPFLLDRSNPAGFDIFYTEDGVNWIPFTVNGLGDPNNYGGRVLLPTQYGLFVMTANPFAGCQVWRLDDANHGITSEAPSEKIVVAAGDSVTFYVTSVGLRPNDIKVTLSDGTVADVKIEVVEVKDGIPTDYWSKVDIVQSPFTGKWAYVEESGDSHPVHLYEVTIKGLKGYKGTLGVTIEIDGVQHSTSFDIRIVGNDGSDFMTAFMILLAISLVVCFVALRFTRPGH